MCKSMPHPMPGCAATTGTCMLPAVAAYLVGCHVCPWVAVACQQESLYGLITLAGVKPAVSSKVPRLACSQVSDLHLHRSKVSKQHRFALEPFSTVCNISHVSASNKTQERQGNTTGLIRNAVSALGKSCCWGTIPWTSARPVCFPCHHGQPAAWPGFPAPGT